MRSRRRKFVDRTLSRVLRITPPTFAYVVRMTAALDRCEVPGLLIGGWQDLFLEQTLKQYRHLRARGVDVAMTVGPWTHTDIVVTAGGTTATETLNWLGTYLAGNPIGGRRSPVRVHVGHHGWLDLPNWPPSTGQGVPYLQPRGRLAATPPPADAAPSTFRYDPADPTPSGCRNDALLADRTDVLSFTSGPLDADLYVLGAPVIELVHEADIDHSTPSHTASPPELRSGCSSPAARTPGTPAISGPANLCSPGSGLCRRCTPCTTGPVAYPN